MTCFLIFPIFILFFLSLISFLKFSPMPRMYSRMYSGNYLHFCNGSLPVPLLRKIYCHVFQIPADNFNDTHTCMRNSSPGMPMCVHINTQVLGDVNM